MNTLTDLLLGVGQPRVSHFPDLCTLLYTYLSTLDYWTKIVCYLFTQTSPVAHTSALTPTYIKSQKLPNWPISKELGLGRMLLPHWKLLFHILQGCLTGYCPNVSEVTLKDIGKYNHNQLSITEPFPYVMGYAITIYVCLSWSQYRVYLRVRRIMTPVINKKYIPYSRKSSAFLKSLF